MSTLESLLEKLKQGGVPVTKALRSMDDQAVSLRDRESQAFIESWKRAFLDLHFDSKGVEIAVPHTSTVQEVGEWVFEAAAAIPVPIEFCNLAAGDFDLIARSLALKKYLPWVNGIWMAYKSGVFPSGKVTEVSGELEALM